MPEGPEVRYIRDLLHKNIVGKRLTNINILKGRYVTHGPPKNLDNFKLPTKCISVDNKGKVIFINFDNNFTIISKLGMTGWWYLNDDEPTWRKSSKNIEFKFSNETLLIYTDIRNFGTITITEDKNIIEQEKNKLGLDVMNENTNWFKFKEALKSLKKIYLEKPLDEILMDQKILICGIGNYLKAECLYEAKIAPNRLVKDIKEEEWKTIFKVIKNKTKQMLKSLLTEDDNKYLENFKIYSKKEDPYGNKIKKYTMKSGRTTYWVPEVQK